MTAKQLPAHVRQLLIDNGHLSITGLSRKARVLDCPHCRVPCIAGLDSHIAALDAWCDPTALTLDGELEALLAGLRTFTLWRGSEIALRHQWIVAADHAKRRNPSPTRTILAQHRCGDPVPDAWAAPQPEPEPAPDDVDDSEESRCPF